MQARDTTVITPKLPEPLIKALEEKADDLGIKIGPVIEKGLRNALEKLKEQPANSAAGQQYLLFQMQNDDRPRKRIGIRMSSELAKEITEVCAQKRVPRERFIETHIDFLVNGWPEMCIPSPLDKAWFVLFESSGEQLNDFYASGCFASEEVLDALRTFGLAVE